jgi:hypothetical protein
MYLQMYALEPHTHLSANSSLTPNALAMLSRVRDR